MYEQYQRKNERGESFLNEDSNNIKNKQIDEEIKVNHEAI